VLERVINGCWRLPTFTRAIRTIIGVTLFHGPVRDGKGWFQSTIAASIGGSLKRRQICEETREETNGIEYRGCAATEWGYGRGFWDGFDRNQTGYLKLKFYKSANSTSM
jgi:hypothetical protein